MIGRIIDLRDPDDYIPFEVYADCVNRARKRNEEERTRLEKMANEKVSVIGLSMSLKLCIGTNGRTYMDIFKIKNGEKKLMKTCRVSDGDNMEKDTKECIKKIFDEFIG